ncbi:MAG: CusA/CzcA family heavy metal efflux RND transporter [Bacteroidota bacterium]|jgi:cobalt-zinc-cadmium resistance protein CzcA
MIQHIVDFSLKNKLLIFLFFTAWTVWGIFETTQLPIDAVPDITNNQVQVISVSNSLGAADIERLVTVPLETAFSNIPGITELRSFSRFGLSIITLVFSDETDVYWARQQIAERIGETSSLIPQGMADISMAPVTTGLGEVYQYIVRPAKGFEEAYSLRELRSIQDWIIRKQLLGTPGVADVSSFGGELMQYQVQILPDRLKAFGITHDEVLHALSSDNQNSGGTYIEKGPKAYFITTSGLFNSIKDIENVPIRYSAGGMPLLIRHVAEVRKGSATRYGAISYNGEREVAGAIVMMIKGENSSHTVSHIKERMDQIRKTLPPGIVVDAFLDRSKMVDNAIKTVETNLLEGALIVILVLVLFLSSLRAGLIVASVIPLSMLFAIILMNRFGISGNLMSLGALDFGLIIDGAVIIVEAVMHSFTRFTGVKKLTSSQKDEEIGKVSTQMMSAAFFGQVIIFIVYIPILSLRGIEGKMFIPMAQTVSFALLGAILASLTWVPVMCAMFIQPQAETRIDKWFVLVRSVYSKWLMKVFHQKAITLTTAMVLLVIAYLLLTRMGGEFIPRLEEGDLAMDTRLLTGASLSNSIETTKRCAALLKSRFPEIEKIVVKTGCGEIPTDPMPIEASDVMIILKDKSAWTSAKTFDQLSEKMKAVVAEIPGVSVGFQFPVQMRFNELMTGAKQDVVCKVYGENLDSLASIASRIKSIAEKTEGIKDMYVEKLNGVEQISIIPYRESFIRHGISMDVFNRALRVFMAGEKCGFVYENERRYGLVVKMQNAGYADIEKIGAIQIQGAGGVQVPLSLLADIQVKPGPNQIMRETGRRRIMLGFNIRGRDVESVVNDLQAQIKKSISLPSGYHYRMGGTFENLMDARKRLSIVVPIALLLIFLMLYFSFSSVPDALVIFMAIPLSAVGGVFLLWFRNMPFSISAAIGFIALFGVAVLNGVVMITEIRRLLAEGMVLREAIVQGSCNRIRPILMTASVASLGFLPMALSNGAGAEVQRPLATVVIGGLVSATLLTLFVLPLLYDWIRRFTSKKTSALLLLLMPMLETLPARAQDLKTISFKEAQSIMYKNNPDLKRARLEKENAEVMKKSWFDAPSMQISAEYGQFNTFANDNRIGLQQSFAFPTAYAASRNYLRSLSDYAELSEQMGMQEKKRELRRLFSAWMLMASRLHLLHTADSLWTEMRRISLARTAAGEDLGADDAIVLAKKSLLQQQVKIAESEKNQIINAFRCLLNTSEPYLPAEDSTVLSAHLQEDTSVYRNFTGSRLLAGHVRSASGLAKYAGNRLLPDISLSVNTQSNTGWFRKGNEEVFYKPGYRFFYAGAGLSFPLFYRSRYAQYQSISYRKKIAEADYESLLLKTNAEVKNLLLRYESQFFANRELQSVSLPAMQKAYQVALRRYQSGESGFTECMYYYNEYFALQQKILETADALNQTIIDMAFYYNQ